MENPSIQRIPLQVSHNCVIASIQVELSEEMFAQFDKDLLEKLQDSGATGIILELSGVEIMDLEDFGFLRRTMAKGKMMGARTIIAGLQPEVVSALIELDAEVDDIDAVQNLDDAFMLIDASVRPTEAEWNG